MGLHADERFLEGDNIGSISHTTWTNAHNKLLCHENLCKEAPCARLGAGVNARGGLRDLQLLSQKSVGDFYSLCDSALCYPVV